MDQDVRQDFLNLYSEIALLREGRAAQVEINRELKEDVSVLTAAVQKLTSAIDQSRGALWVISGVSGVAGAIVSWGASLLFHKPGA